MTATMLARKMVRQRAEAQMTATVAIVRGDLAAFDPATGQVGGLANARTVYRGKARIRTVSGAGTVTVGGGEIDTRTTLISIPVSAAPTHRDDVIQVVDDRNSDPQLTSMVFRVLEVEGGSLFADARRMSCTSWTPSRYWGNQ